MARPTALVLLALQLTRTSGLDNGVGRVPPMGWTSWTSAFLNVNQTFMESAMDVLAKKRADGVSLRSLGYTHAGLDDGWQACGEGWHGSFHNKSGHPLVNLSRFPDMAAMTAHARSRGLQSGWYLNNCFCNEQNWTDSEMVAAHYEGDVEALMEYGFDGVKFDACSQFQNLSRYERLINATDHQMMIENCHWGGDGPRIVDDELWCPYNIYRSGMDIAPGSWASMLTNLDSLTKFINNMPSKSRPFCWAYPDSVQTGSFARIEEDRTNFGAWCITSSPLILGMDVTNEAALDRVWSILTNSEAINVNQRWVGHSGWLVKQKHHDLPVRFVVAADCSTEDPLQHDWSFGLAFVGPAGPITSKSTGLCADMWSGSMMLEPCTNNASQRFVFHEGTRKITMPDWSPNLCLDLSGGQGPRVHMAPCKEWPNQEFSFSADGVFADGGGPTPFPKKCMVVQLSTELDGSLYAKPQPAGAMAVFALNAGQSDSFSFEEIDLELDLGLLPGRKYSVRDIWNHKDLSPVQDKLSTGNIANHDSVFLLLTPHSDGSVELVV